MSLLFYLLVAKALKVIDAPRREYGNSKETLLEEAEYNYYGPLVNIVKVNRRELIGSGQTTRHEINS